MRLSDLITEKSGRASSSKCMAWASFAVCVGAVVLHYAGYDAPEALIGALLGFGATNRIGSKYGETRYDMYGGSEWSGTPPKTYE